MIMKIKKGDTVLITAGKDKNRTGKVLKVFPKKHSLLVEGMNLKKKHVRPKKSGEKGQIVQVALALDVSNVKIICPKCAKAARIGCRTEKERKFRICKKCGQEI
ncbi:MAG: large subunit ribosomal protein L24 [Parcubacteria group bacterium Licking1014_1]|nr:MAG: large subunit ribosomal protein L24 [Parcubacteria group bacterium Licking1014_1]